MRYLFTAYNSLLKKYPLTTNCISTGILMGLGDILAQYLFPINQQSTIINLNFDYTRTLRAIIFGSCIFGPVGHTWYKFLGTKIHWKCWNRKNNIDLFNFKLKSTLFRVIIDQIIFVPFICYPLYYSSMTLLEFKKPILKNLKIKFEEKWWITVKTNWMIWPFVQFGNFYLLPPHLRLLMINFVSIGWNTFLSYILNKSK